MANLVLYRKYRPKSFSEVVGQEHIIRTITNEIANDSLAQCYLFSGPKGSGKTTVARLLAKAINCEDKKGFEPCNKCSSCLEINRGGAIDLIEIDAASNRGIDDIRELRQGIRFVPTKLSYKIFIIDEAHQLTKDAANALLKILEEPPSFAIFVLATTEIHKMIPTIISRCQQFTFRKLSVPEMIGKLDWIVKQEKVKIAKPALELIAMNSEGAMRNAEVLLDKCISFSKSSDKKEISAEDIKEMLGIVDLNLVSEFIDLIFAKKAGESLKFLNQVIEKGIDPSEFLKTTINYLRQGLLLKISQNLEELVRQELTKEALEILEKQISELKENDLRRALKVFLSASDKIKYSSIPQLPIELAILELIEDK